MCIKSSAENMFECYDFGNFVAREKPINIWKYEGTYKFCKTCVGTTTIFQQQQSNVQFGIFILLKFNFLYCGFYRREVQLHIISFQ